jgi:Uma2 family endonuclease
VEQFHRLCEAVPEQRLELIEGEVFEVIAKGTRHSAVVNLKLRVESPLDLGISNEPEPDLALVRFRADNYLEAHPTAADTLLVIEVADSSLRFDLEAKARFYAAAEVPTYWVVDVLQPRLIRVHEAAALEPLLFTLRGEVEALLAGIPPSTPS